MLKEKIYETENVSNFKKNAKDLFNAFQYSIDSKFLSIDEKYNY